MWNIFPYCLLIMLKLFVFVYVCLYYESVLFFIGLVVFGWFGLVWFGLTNNIFFEHIFGLVTFGWVEFLYIFF